MAMTPEEKKADRARWLAEAKASLAETLEEIALFEQDIPAWERKCGMKFPGAVYKATMHAQATRLQRDIARHCLGDDVQIPTRDRHGLSLESTRREIAELGERTAKRVEQGTKRLYTGKALDQQTPTPRLDEMPAESVGIGPCPDCHDPDHGLAGSLKGMCKKTTKVETVTTEITEELTGAGEPYREVLRVTRTHGRTGAQINLTRDEAAVLTGTLVRFVAGRTPDRTETGAKVAALLERLAQYKTEIEAEGENAASCHECGCVRGPGIAEDLDGFILEARKLLGVC